jgi:hypothetical protein
VKTTQHHIVLPCSNRVGVVHNFERRLIFVKQRKLLLKGGLEAQMSQMTSLSAHSQNTATLQFTYTSVLFTQHTLFMSNSEAEKAA